MACPPPNPRPARFLLIPPVDLDLCRFMLPRTDLLLELTVLALEEETTLAETEERARPSAEDIALEEAFGRDLEAESEEEDVLGTEFN